MSVQVQRASILSGRQLVLAVTIALHAAAISALMAWRIAEVMTRTSDDPIQVIDMKPEVRREVPPIDENIIRTVTVPVPRDPGVPQIDDPDGDVHTLTATDETVGDGNVGGVGTSTTEQRPVPPDTPLQYRATRPSDDYYPPQAIRLQEQGATIVRTCVDATGALSTLPQVVKSSRSRLLDAAAIAWAREALQFTPATRAGIAIPGCKEFRVNFTLH